MDAELWIWGSLIGLCGCVGYWAMERLLPDDKKLAKRILTVAIIIAAISFSRIIWLRSKDREDDKAAGVQLTNSAVVNGNNSGSVIGIQSNTTNNYMATNLPKELQPSHSATTQPEGLVLSTTSFPVKINGQLIRLSPDGAKTYFIPVDFNSTTDIDITLKNETETSLKSFQVQFLVRGCEVRSDDPRWWPGTPEKGDEETDGMLFVQPSQVEIPLYPDVPINLPKVKLTCKKETMIVNGNIKVSAEEMKRPYVVPFALKRNP